MPTGDDHRHLCATLYLCEWQLGQLGKRDKYQFESDGSVCLGLFHNFLQISCDWNHTQTTRKMGKLGQAREKPSQSHKASLYDSKLELFKKIQEVQASIRLNLFKSKALNRENAATCYNASFSKVFPQSDGIRNNELANCTWKPSSSCTFSPPRCCRLCLRKSCLL